MKNTYNPNTKKDGLIVDQILTGGHMLSGGFLQDILEQSTVQNYDIGTRFLTDMRTFYYCKAGTAMRELIPGVCGMSQIECNTHAAASLAGTYEVTILDVVARVVDWYKGGYFWGMVYAPATTGLGVLYRIASSEASAGTSVKLTLDRPLVNDVAASSWTTSWANIYGNVQNGVGLTQASMVCMPLIQVANGSFFWGQTWGPCFGQSGYTPGVKVHDREVYYRADHEGFMPGSTVVFESDVVPQRVGFWLPNTGVVGTDNFFMLQLAP